MIVVAVWITNALKTVVFAGGLDPTSKRLKHLNTVTYVQCKFLKQIVIFDALSVF